MALSGYEKQKRWREKNRALYNLQQRNRRKKLGSGVEGHAQSVRDHESENQRGSNGGETGNPTPSENQASPALFTTKKVGEFRMVVLPEEKPATEVSESTDTRSRSDIAMGIWRNDQGGVISKFAYDKLQKLKEHAKEKEFEIDNYSQL